MKGLLIKDFFCLKKQLINYIFVIVGVIVISILFVLSCNFGNIHEGFAGLVDSGQGTEENVIQITSVSLLMFMLIPLACTGDITNLITDDENASFYKVASALPVSIAKRVACRFLTGYLFIATGVVVDFIMTVILSSLTDIISFGKFCGVTLTFASIMMMYVSLFILLVYFLGKGKTTYASVSVIVFGAVLYVLAHFDRLKAWIIDSDDRALSDIYSRTTEFMFHKSYMMLIAAMIISGAAYVAAVHIAGRKRGMV